MPCPADADYRRLARLQRRIARRTRGSRAQRKARKAIGRWHTTQANKRNDFIAKSVFALTRDYSFIAIEDLAVDSMTRRAKRGRARKAGLNRELLARAFGTFRSRLEKKSPWTGTIVVAVDPRHTSQMCSCCGFVARENRESQAVFRCGSCGYEAHADINAALNILSRAGHARIHAAGADSLEGSASNAEPCVTSTEASHV
jgi:IS605 OrfB family transposase